MGFLDGSNANIIVDAVLTDKGREALASGNFVPVKFSLGDDEVDYSLVKKFGLVVGREKIEKNTPVFESQTSSAYGLKYRCVTITTSPETVTYLPYFTASSTSLSISASSSTRSTSVSVYQKTSDTTAVIPTDLIDNDFIVKVPSRFLSIVGATYESKESNNVLRYRIAKTGTDQSNGVNATYVTLTLAAVPLAASSDFALFGNGSQINTAIEVFGASSGASLRIPVTLTKT